MADNRYSNAPRDDQVPVESLDSMNDRLIDLMAARADALRLATEHNTATKPQRDAPVYIGLATGVGVGFGMAFGAVVATYNDHHIGDHAPLFFAGVTTFCLSAAGIAFKWLDTHFYGTQPDHTAHARELDEQIFELTARHPNFTHIRMHHFDDTPKRLDEKIKKNTLILR